MFLKAASILAAAWLAQGISEDELFRLAEQARKEGRPQEALAGIETLLERRPDQLKAHVGYQKLLRIQKNTSQLVEEYKALLETRGEGWCHYLYGRLLRDPKRKRKGLALDPKNFELRITLADVLRRNFRREEAVSKYRAALPDRPEALREHLAYIKLRRDSGKPAEVLREYQARLEKSPGDSRSHLLYPSALLTFGIESGTKEHLDRVLELAPGNLYVLGGLGVYYITSKNPPMAQNALEEALRPDPYHPGTLYQQGVRLLFFLNDDRGFEPLRKAAYLDPDSSRIFSDLGAAYLTPQDGGPRRGKPEEVFRPGPDQRFLRSPDGSSRVGPGGLRWRDRMPEQDDRSLPLRRRVPHVLG